MILGRGFFTPDRSDKIVSRHLWFILSDPKTNSRIVLANVSTKPCSWGENYTIAPGEHPRISRVSYLRFDQVRVSSREGLQDLFNKNKVQLVTPASPELIQKLQRAIKDSSNVPTEAQKILKEQGISSS